MYSQHKQLARVWALLQGRRDNACVLREIIGQHAIDSLGNEVESQSVDQAIRTTIWIKTIFDLQRALLSGTSTGVAECPPYLRTCLLPSELLLSSILYLVDIKTRVFSTQIAVVTEEFGHPRLILAQAVLSGLRLLLLRRENITAVRKRRLRRSINAAWQGDQLQGMEQFIVSKLFAEILDIVNDTSTDNPYQQELIRARLPSYASGLYPLDGQPETFVTPLIHGTMEEDWIHAYLVLLDCLWAAEIAIIQRILDLSRNDVDTWEDDNLETDEVLQQLYHTRSSLVLSIFHVTGPMTPEPGLLNSLALTLLEWNEDLDIFLSRQDLLLQRRSLSLPGHFETTSYGRLVLELAPYFSDALTSFHQWLSSRSSQYDLFDTPRIGAPPYNMQNVLKDWMSRMSSSASETVTKDMDGSLAPFVVDCPKLHVIPKKLLAYKLRWSDKFAYEAVQGNSPITTWKEGIQCPSCGSSAMIKHARLIEPLQQPSSTSGNVDSGQFIVGPPSAATSASYIPASSSSRSMSEAERSALSIPSRASQASLDTHGTSYRSSLPPDYSVSPIDSTFSMTSKHPRSPGSSLIDNPVSPLDESLNIPIPLNPRISMELPIPVSTELDARLEKIPTTTTESSSVSFDGAALDRQSSGSSPYKGKSTSRTARFAEFSMKRKPTLKKGQTEPLPRETAFSFSASGHSLLIWGKLGESLVRLDIPSNELSATQGCRYEVSRIAAAACGNHKCAVLATSDLQHHSMVLFDGINVNLQHEILVDFTGRITDVCLAVSRNDTLAALSVNDDIHIYALTDNIKPLSFHHQIHVYEMRGGVSHRRTIPVGRTSSEDFTTHRQGIGPIGHDKDISSKEAAEEQRRQSVIVSRKLSFSPDNKCLVVATQLGDHCVYVDVWDCTREPVSTISEQSRSFRLPPWTLNDGDLTSVFYDSFRRSAVVTAFLGKEYPMLIPFPGSDALQNETYSTKIVHAAQSPSGIFVAVNAMTEMIQFEYTSKGQLSPRRLRKASSKISNSAFKPGAIALGMPMDNVLQCLWIKDQKCMLRTVNIGATGETVSDFDLRPHYDRLMSLKGKAVIASAPTLGIPELDG